MWLGKAVCRVRGAVCCGDHRVAVAMAVRRQLGVRQFEAPFLGLAKRMKKSGQVESSDEGAGKIKNPQ